MKSRLFLIALILLLILTASVAPLTSLASVNSVPVAAPVAIVRQPLSLTFSDGVKTSAEIDYPGEGSGPFPAVLMLGGSGASDMNGATSATPNITPYKDMLDNLVSHGFLILKYNKRGLGTNGFITNQRVSDGRTNDRLVADSMTALQQLESDKRVDQDHIFILAHSQGTLIAPQLAQQAPGKIKGLVLAGTIADWNAAFDFQLVDFYVQLADEVDANHDGTLSPDELTAAFNSDPTVYTNQRRKLLFNLGYFQTTTPPGGTTSVICDSPIDLNHDCLFSIKDELQPALQKVRQGLLTNTSLLRASGESATALQSLLNGPTLGQVLPALKIPTLFQQGSDDERAPLAPIKAVQAQINDLAVSNGLTIYPNETHNLVPDEVVLDVALKHPLPPQILPQNVLDDQVDWFERIVQPNRPPLDTVTPATTVVQTTAAPITNVPTTLAPTLTTMPTTVVPTSVATLTTVPTVEQPTITVTPTTSNITTVVPTTSQATATITPTVTQPVVATAAITTQPTVTLAPVPPTTAPTMPHSGYGGSTNQPNAPINLVILILLTLIMGITILGYVALKIGRRKHLER